VFWHKRSSLLGPPTSYKENKGPLSQLKKLIPKKSESFATNALAYFGGTAAKTFYAIQRRLAAFRNPERSPGTG
jgi:hypothetical protein